MLKYSKYQAQQRVFIVACVLRCFRFQNIKNDIFLIIKFNLCAALLFYASMTKADQFYVTVGFDCDNKKQELNIIFKGAWNEKGKNLIGENDKNTWSSWDLVSINNDSEGSYKIIEKPISRVCIMAGRKYGIDISPLMAPGFHPEGKCASRMGANVILRSNGKILISKGLDACTQNGNVIKSISVKPGKKMFLTEIPAEYFYAEN